MRRLYSGPVFADTSAIRKNILEVILGTSLMVISIFAVLSLLGCPGPVRQKGEPYPGYSCRESILHYGAYCQTEDLGEEDLAKKVADCEKELAGPCDKERAGLLWCMGRAYPAGYSQGRGVLIPDGKGSGISAGSSAEFNGCDCSEWTEAIRDCRIKNGPND